MKKNIKFLLVFMFVMFSSILKVDAAQELTCMYEKGKNKTGAIDKVILVQDKNGSISIFKNKKDVGINDTTSYWYLSDDKYVLTSANGVKLKNGKLTECPKSKSTAATGSGKVTFYGSETKGNQKLVGNGFKYVIVPKLKDDQTDTDNQVNNKIPELTCVYKYDEIIKRKIVMTQTSIGKITIYENDKDVGIDDISHYWKNSDIGNSFSNITDYKNNNYLKKCPSTYSVSYEGKGYIDFTDDERYESTLESSEYAILPIQVASTSTVDDDLEYDVDNNKGKKCDNIDDSTKWLREKGDFTLTCLYESTLYDSYCHIIQVSAGNVGVDVFDSDTSKYGEQLSNYKLNRDEITQKNIEQNAVLGAGCPRALYVKRVHDVVEGYTYIDTKLSFKKKNKDWVMYNIVDVEGNDFATGNKASKDFGYNIEFNKIKITNCDELLKNAPELVDLLRTIVKVIFIVVPLILLVMGSIDFGQAIFASNEDGIKKAQSKFIKRLILAVIIFLIPSILSFVLEIAHTVWPVVDSSLCGILD